jgi:uncharacterized protein YbjT (DUF2867 family)
MGSVLIVGGTGMLGGYLTRRLLAAGTPVRVMSRCPDRAVALRDAGAEVVEGDLLDGDSLIRACDGADGSSRRRIRCLAVDPTRPRMSTERDT